MAEEYRVLKYEIPHRKAEKSFSEFLKENDSMGFFRIVLNSFGPRTSAANSRDRVLMVFSGEKPLGGIFFNDQGLVAIASKTPKEFKQIHGRTIGQELVSHMLWHLNPTDHIKSTRLSEDGQKLFERLKEQGYVGEIKKGIGKTPWRIELTNKAREFRPKLKLQSLKSL